MLIERNQVVIGVVSAIVLAVATLFSVFVVDDLLRRGDTITVEFANSEGLAAGDEVLIAGYRAGQVDNVEIVGDRIEVQLVAEHDLPVDTRARIVLRNFLGRVGIELEAGNQWDQLLADQDDPRIPLENTEPLADFPQLNEDTVALFRNVDTDAMETMVVALADITQDQREEFGALLDGISDFAEILAENREALSQMIVRAETLVDAAADRDEDLVTIIDEFGSTLNVLAQRRGDLQRLLRDTASSTTLVADLVSDERDRIDRSLAELHEVLEIADARQVDLAHAFAYGGVAFHGFAQVGAQGDRDNPYWGDIMTTGAGIIGIDAIAGCGGAIDQALDAIFGPGQCPDHEAEEDDGRETPEDDDGDSPLPAPSMHRLFGVEVRR
jgi:phospholipid/cholesterol/gamma-HCH transport system substrate-binding protein